jgi:hypothetical protein
MKGDTGWVSVLKRDLEDRRVVFLGGGGGCRPPRRRRRRRRPPPPPVGTEGSTVAPRIRLTHTHARATFSALFHKFRTRHHHSHQPCRRRACWARRPGARPPAAQPPPLRPPPPTARLRFAFAAARPRSPSRARGEQPMRRPAPRPTCSPRAPRTRATGPAGAAEADVSFSLLFGRERGLLRLWGLQLTPRLSLSPIPPQQTGMRCAAAATDADILELTEENVEKVLDEVRALSNPETAAPPVLPARAAPFASRPPKPIHPPPPPNPNTKRSAPT